MKKKFDNNSVKYVEENKDQDYVGKSKQILNKFKVKVGDDVKITTNKEEFIGIVLPRYETFNDEFIVIKLKNGYNVGILIGKILNIVKINISQSINSSSVSSVSSVSHYNYKDKNSDNFNSSKDSASKSLPRILLLSTGGTIASKIDYRTGGVTSVLNASDLYSTFPELSDYGNIDTEFLFNEYSENLTPQHWSMLSQRVFNAIQKEQYDGVIISHGTDTMHYTSSALSFSLQNIPIPVVLVGSQRSSDRPSSDAFSNLLGAMKFIKETIFAGIFVCMHQTSSDDVIAIHLGTRVRKSHTSKRNAFKSLDSIPFAQIENSEIKYNPLLHDLVRHRNSDLKEFTMKSSFDNRVFLLKYFPGFNQSFLELFLKLDYKVIILEGTGLGHINKSCFPLLKAIIDSGIVIFMTSQCIFGRVNMNVYDTGRDLLDLGIIPLSDMSSETAIVKAMWALSNNSDPTTLIKTMKSECANEISNALPIVN